MASDRTRENPRKGLALFIALGALFLSIFFGLREMSADGVKAYFRSMTLPRGDQLRHTWGALYDGLLFVRRITPQESLIIVPPPQPSFSILGERKVCLYFLFPRLAVREGDPRIKTHQGPVYKIQVKGFMHRGSYLEKHDYDRNASLLLLRKGENRAKMNAADFTAEASQGLPWEAGAVPARPVGTDVPTGRAGGGPKGRPLTEVRFSLLNGLAALGKFLLIMLLGTYATARYFDQRTWLGFATSSFLVGTVCFTVAHILFNFLGIPFGEGPQFLFLTSSGALGAWLWRKRPKGAGLHFERPVPAALPGSLIVLVFFGLLFLKNLTAPIQGWDGHITWGMRAKILFAFHELKAFDTWVPLPYYPPLLPVVMSCLATGGEPAVNLLFPFFALCLYAAVREQLIGTNLHPALIDALPLILFTSRQFFVHAHWAYANLPLSAFVTTAIIFLSRALAEGKASQGVAASIMMGGVVLVRPEGTGFFLCLAAVLILLRIFRGAVCAGQFALWIPLACIFIWDSFCWFRMNALPNTLATLARLAPKAEETVLNWEYFGTALSQLVSYALGPSWWGMIPLSFLILLAVKTRQTVRNFPVHTAFFLLATLSIAPISYFLARNWIGTDFFYATGFVRFYMPVVPVMLIVVLRQFLDSLAGEGASWKPPAGP